MINFLMNILCRCMSVGQTYTYLSNDAAGLSKSTNLLVLLVRLELVLLVLLILWHLCHLLHLQSSAHSCVGSLPGSQTCVLCVFPNKRNTNAQLLQALMQQTSAHAPTCCSCATGYTCNTSAQRSVGRATL